MVRAVLAEADGHVALAHNAGYRRPPPLTLVPPRCEFFLERLGEELRVGTFSVIDEARTARDLLGLAGLAVVVDRCHPWNRG